MRPRRGPLGALLLVAALAVGPTGSTTVSAEGVGGATWTPSESETTSEASQFLSPGDSITFRTDASWNSDQVRGLGRYIDDGLRYTLEVNDRGDRLNATGFWASNHPDPAYDRDDDDGNGRWEEAEVIAGAVRPEAGRTYTSLVQFSRWHPKRLQGSCEWAWDRRLGTFEVLSQLSRDLLGEWQAERYTLNYETRTYPRVGSRPDLPERVPKAKCRDVRAGDGQHGYVITFAAPLSFDDFLARPDAGGTKWTAFEAIGTSDRDKLTWTCGGPVMPELGLRPCASMGVDAEGVVAAVGYLDDLALRNLRQDPLVARVDGLQDSLTGLLFDVGGFGVQLPGLTVNDRYWELFLAD